MKMVIENKFSAKVEIDPHLPLQTVIDTYARTPCFYLLDCLESDPETIQRTLETSSQSPAPDHITVALYNVADGKPLAPLVKPYRIRGIFYQDGSRVAFIKGIETMLAGHLWISRKMLSTCIRDTHRDIAGPDGSRAQSLTNREMEIIAQLAFDKSNQEIADALQISLNTVKNHLYKIYKKINVPNRRHASRWVKGYQNRN